MKQYLFRRDGSLIYTEKEWWEKFGCSDFIHYFCILNDTQQQRYVRGQVSDIHKIGGSLIHIAMKIPDVVLQEASETMEMLEGTIVYLGKIGDGREVYLFKQPIDAETGFPFVYLYDGQSLCQGTGE